MEMTEHELNTILEALGNMPYKQVAPVIYKIQTQCSQQVQENQRMD